MRKKEKLMREKEKLMREKEKLMREKLMRERNREKKRVKLMESKDVRDEQKHETRNGNRFFA